MNEVTDGSTPKNDPDPAAYQGRARIEKQELDQKIAKLRAFLDPVTLHGVSPQEHDRLKRQLAAMEAYSQVLGERIANF